MTTAPLLDRPAARPDVRPRRPRPGRLLRSALFWMHLAVGVATGLVVLVMSATGAALAFQRQMVEWSASRHMPAPPAGAERLPLDSLLAAARAQLPPEPTVTAVTVKRDPSAPVSFTLPARRSAAVDPYTGERLAASAALQAFFFEMERWHRSLAAGEGLRAEPGTTITGASNLAFLVLILSGLVLWLPRRWSWRAVRAVLLPRRGVRGRQRDWNWHHVAGIWAAPVLVVLVASGVFISYRWPATLLERAFGETPAAEAARGGAGRGARSAREGAEAASSAGAPTLEDVLARSTAHVPSWRSVSIRLPREAGAPYAVTVATSDAIRPDRRVSLEFDARTGAMTEGASYASLSASRKVRGWMRWLHTGEALGVTGQAVAGLACVAGVLLVWTGLALAWRRFLRAVRRREREMATA